MSLNVVMKDLLILTPHDVTVLQSYCIKCSAQTSISMQMKLKGIQSTPLAHQWSNLSLGICWTPQNTETMECWWCTSPWMGFKLQAAHNNCANNNANISCVGWWWKDLKLFPSTAVTFTWTEASSVHIPGREWIAWDLYWWPLTPSDANNFIYHIQVSHKIVICINTFKHLAC